MRYTVLFLALPMLFVYGIGCGNASKRVTEELNGEFEVRIYEVFGMNCPGCHGGLNKLVKKIPEVQHAESNWEKKRLIVTVRPGAQLSDDDIYDAIRRANFTPGKRMK